MPRPPIRSRSRRNLAALKREVVSNNNDDVYGSKLSVAADA